MNNLHFLVLILTFLFSCFLAGDTERLVVPVFPVFFLLLGIIFEKISFNELKARIIVLSLCIMAIPHHIFFRFRLPTRNWKVALSMIALLTVTAYFYKLKKDRSDVIDNNTDI